MNTEYSYEQEFAGSSPYTAPEGVGGFNDNLQNGT